MRLWLVGWDDQVLAILRDAQAPLQIWQVAGLMPGSDHSLRWLRTRHGLNRLRRKGEVMIGPDGWTLAENGGNDAVIQDELTREWAEYLALKFAHRRTGGSVYMDGRHNPLPSERQEAEMFVIDLLAAARALNNTNAKEDSDA